MWRVLTTPTINPDRDALQDPDADRPGGPAELAAAMGASTGEMAGVLDAFTKDIDAGSLGSTVRFSCNGRPSVTLMTSTLP